MKKVCFLLTIPSALLMLLVLSVNLASAKTFNNDFETGDLTDWEADGEAFDFQPTWGDNPTARNRGQPSEHQGDWWLGLYEKYQGPDKGKKLGQNPGATQGDGPQGTLTSIEFTIVGKTMNFLIGGGNHPWKDDPAPCSVNLEIDGKVVLTSTGNNTETMARVEWDLSGFDGETAQIVVVDNNSGGWGHPNFDDIHQADSRGRNIPWEQVLTVDARGKLAATWAQMKKYY
ncbi:hypothetical protein F4Y59_07830 [Candidatus Poribacteria bacterium]|nr:hypothetical protein [Candidatus Poribacteria bacterium]MXY28053.1 hypothetical protein [Candidatus Poribacteria bacterium]MYK19936.1 hypothetical protein [Candidatus Poribacteria bacterium]